MRAGNWHLNFFSFAFNYLGNSPECFRLAQIMPRASSPAEGFADMIATQYRSLLGDFLRVSFLAGACLLSPLLAATVQAADQPAVVTIIGIAGVQNGKLAYTGTPAVVQQQGWLDSELSKRHIKLEWIPVSSAAVASQVNESLAKGVGDFAAYGDLPSIIANASGISTKLIVPGGSLTNTYLMVPWNSTAKSIQDLKGKRIALNRGRPWEYGFGKLLARNGLSNRDFRILNLNPQAGAAAVATGSADGYFTTSNAYTLQDQKVARIIWSSKGESADWKMHAELWGTTDFVKRYPDITQVIATAFIRAAYWSSQPEHIDTYIEYTGRLGTRAADTRQELQGNKISWKDRWSPLFDTELRKHYAGVNDYAAKAGLIAHPIDVNTLFAPQFANHALDELHLRDYWVSASDTSQ
jgi:sulfonate transport system substrate-binding protein